MRTHGAPKDKLVLVGPPNQINPVLVLGLALGKLKCEMLYFGIFYLMLRYFRILNKHE